VVIHCAGIAHQKIGAVDAATYMRVNGEATENLAKAAAESNSGVCFIFLSSVSVYGEGGQITSRKGAPVKWSSNLTGQAKALRRLEGEKIRRIKPLRVNSKQEKVRRLDCLTPRLNKCTRNLTG